MMNKPADFYGLLSAIWKLRSAKSCEGNRLPEMPALAYVLYANRPRNQNKEWDPPSEHNIPRHVIDMRAFEGRDQSQQFANAMKGVANRISIELPNQRKLDELYRNSLSKLNPHDILIEGGQVIAKRWAYLKRGDDPNKRPKYNIYGTDRADVDAVVERL